MVSTIIAGNKSSQKLGKSQSPCGQGQSELSEDDVKQFVAKEVIYYKKVREVTFVDKISKAPSGKILRKELRKQLQQQHQVV
ncbi:hypothetical protein BDA96_01G496500 [Sorghum bicolor]|uniref:AMP-binding enzyme C-terminal domain-containing protein n=2 Tax=Sorghum bicolor TaxID=4558 RepID=A0A921S622_SORBI|nr:hypothetical protein BDA96_01G496500 [Sorghum bicolor]KXG39935.1 hypothetical protein SORBI_3001G465600 [Sorghum bicolor]